jgi:pimeloyl-ACP methyl ester carboxylesterase
MLIHGAWHGGWCWKKVARLLREKDNKVIAPDLPGHGNDKTPIQEVTLANCVDKVCNILDAQSEPVILVGHSMGGIVISQTAEERPERIRLLVYLSAALVPNGYSVISMLDGRRYRYMANKQDLVFIKENLLKEKFYGDCTDEDVAFAQSLLGPENPAMFAKSLRLSEANFCRVPRCLHRVFIR